MNKRELYIKPFIVINNDKMIKVTMQDELHYCGFDIISENFKIIPKIGSFEISETIIKLIGCEKTRIKTAIAISKDNTDASALLSMGEKTFYRKRKEHWDQKPIRKHN